MPNIEYKMIRGCEDAVIAELTETTGEDGVVTASYGEVTPLGGLNAIDIAVDESSQVYYADNGARVAVAGKGNDTVTLTMMKLTLQARALIEGGTYSTTKEAYIGTKQKKRYFALGFKIGNTDGTQDYYWYYKGIFTAGNVSANTEDNGTDASFVDYTYTAVDTAVAYQVDTGINEPARFSIINSTNEAAPTFFDEVTTPDKIGAVA